jgi:succinate-semialdehyde dehydrogenase/glutarate-semialdehyde dehydrogenase
MPSAKVEELLDDAKAKGAHGRAGRVKPHELGGSFYPADRHHRGHAGYGLRHKKRSSARLRPSSSFETEEEAIEMANATVFGFASYVYTRRSEPARSA